MTDVAHSGTGDEMTEAQVLKQKVVAAKEALADLAGETKHFAAHRLSDARDTTGQWLKGAKAKAKDCADDVSGYIQRNPYKSVAIAAGVGLLVGLLLKRR
jgi:ElaB/YqjD/DUF883 family membrane-anchored ribosome-binding protein